MKIGPDISSEMITRARELHPGATFVSDKAQLTQADYTIASGIFNVKLDASEEDWRAYMFRTIADLASLGTRGFAFNALTSYSDADKRRADLHYADPLELFEHCRCNYSRFVTVVHDYPLYEFTILVRVGV